MSSMSWEMLLGNTDNGDPVTVSQDQRKKHMFVVGKSGGGKSKSLEWMIREDILNNPDRPGLLLIDPHAELYENIVDYCAFIGTKRKIHLFNPSDPNFIPCYNPLKSGTAEPDVLARSMAEGCAQVFGEDSMSTPLIRTTLLAVFYALIVKNCTIAEAPYLMSIEEDDRVREYLTTNLGDYVMQEKWDNINELPRNPRTKHEFTMQMAPADRRVFELLMSPLIRAILGQSDNSLNIAECMERGDIVLVNLSTERNVLSTSDAQLLGTLLLRDVYVSAMARDRSHANHPFYVYVDECYKYLTSDVESMLDEVRKKGVHLILACQRLGQLREAGESIYNGVMTTETKIVFGGLEKNDAIDMAEEIYMTEIDLERGVELTKNPSVVGHRVEIFESRTEGEARSFTESESSGVGESVYIPEEDEPSGVTASESSGTSSSESRSYSRSRTESEQLVPVMKNVYSTTWGIDKLIWEKASYLKNQPTQHATVYKHSVGSESIKIPFVKSAPNKPVSDLTKLFIARTQEDSGIFLEKPTADQLIQERQTRLLESAIDADREEEPDSFRS